MGGINLYREQSLIIKHLFAEEFFDFCPQTFVNIFFPDKKLLIFAVIAIVGDKGGFDFFLIDRMIGNKIMFVALVVFQCSAGSLDKIFSVIHNHKFYFLVKFFLQSS